MEEERIDLRGEPKEKQYLLQRLTHYSLDKAGPLPCFNGLQTERPSR